MIVLHDLRLESDGLSAQIDYLIITPKINFILECKNLYGDIEVNSAGDFIRTIPVKGQKIREGIYSPITQNQRHLEMIRKVRMVTKTNFIARTVFESSFSNLYQSIVVLANPKTVLDLKYARKEIKDQIIRADQLNQTIVSRNNASKEVPSFEKNMYDLAEFFLNIHKPNPNDYLEKYRSLVSDHREEKQVITITSEVSPQVSVTINQPAVKEPPIDTLPIEQTPIYLDLKKYRYETSQAEGVKAYFVFNNAELVEIISKKPASESELKRINGFGEVKCQKYGPAILEIIAKHQ